MEPQARPAPVAFPPTRRWSGSTRWSCSALDADAFRERFKRTSLWRNRRAGLLRNAAIVLGEQPATSGRSPAPGDGRRADEEEADPRRGARGRSGRDSSDGVRVPKRAMDPVAFSVRHAASLSRSIRDELHADRAGRKPHRLPRFSRFSFIAPLESVTLEAIPLCPPAVSVARTPIAESPCNCSTRSPARGLLTDADRSRAADAIKAAPEFPPHQVLIEKGFVKEEPAPGARPRSSAWNWST